MIKCNLQLTDWFTKKVTTKVIMPKDPQVAAKIHSKNNPNASVVLEYHDPKYMRIALLPHSMELDQALVDGEELDMDYFMSKWYGKVSKAKMKELQAELEAEFINNQIED